HVDRRVAQPQLGSQSLSLFQEACRQLDVATYGFDRGESFEDGRDTRTIADRPGLCEEVQAGGDELVEPAGRERNVVLDLPRLDLTGTSPARCMASTARSHIRSNSVTIPVPLKFQIQAAARRAAATVDSRPADSASAAASAAASLAPR